MVQQQTWWGQFNFAIGEIRAWHIGPLRLVVQRLKDEWQIAHERADDFDEDKADWQVAHTDMAPSQMDKVERYVTTDSSGILDIAPMLANRPLISRPSTTFNLVAGEDITLYVSTPLWIVVGVGSKPKTLVEISVQRPSDIWFGPSTLQGELCYATTTSCRLHRDELPHRPHRAVTPVTIRNKADSNLLVERLKVPGPQLPIFSSIAEQSSQQLWTPRVTLVRQEDGDMVELKIDEHPPSEVKKPKLLREPRNAASNGVLIRALNAVFG